MIPSTRSLRGARARREPEPAGEPPPPERSGVVGRLRRPFRLGPMRLSTRLALTAAAAVCVVLAGFALGTYLLIADRPGNGWTTRSSRPRASSRGPRAGASSG